VKGSASTDRLLWRKKVEKELRKKVEHWQRNLEDDPDRGPGMCVGSEQMEKLREQLQRFQESGEEKLSTTDPDARFVRDGKRFVLGYTGEIAVSADHFIVAQRVTQNRSDNASLVPMMDEVKRQGGQRTRRVLADCGFFSGANVREMEQRGIETYVPDPNMAHELRTGERASRIGRVKLNDPQLLRARRRMRSAAGRGWYKKRKALVEPVFGTLKQQRGMRQFERRGLAAVAVEWTLAAIAYNVTHYHNLRRQA
jgi:hypothetical protein